nr:uncharacterized protein LOC129254191 [Lytechinus pictus]
MSSVKKLSLSGFKSTFKRKTSRGISRNHSPAQLNGDLQQGCLCDNDLSKSNGEYQNIPTKNRSGNVKSEEITPTFNDKHSLKNRESKSSRWGLRQKADGKSKHGNESETMINSCEPGSGVDSDRDCMVDDSDVLCNPPSANGHIVMRNRNMNEYDIDTGYVGARSVSSPRISNNHSFHEGISSHYINNPKSRKSETEPEVLPHAENKRTNQTTEYNRPLPVPTCSSVNDKHCENEVQTNVNNMMCDINDNAAIFEQRLDECLENNMCLKDVDESVPSTETPPAIPPKPASLYCNGQWQLQDDKDPDSVQSKNMRNSTLSLGENPDVPPRPPARSKRRHGVDLSLPFNRMYLEMKERSCSQTVPVYEDVKVELGLESGGLAGELSKLPRQPWYWGPMSQDEAEGKLSDADDGSFLVRDSSDDRYLLTLSFKSSGRTLHTRIEHRNGLFSLNDSEGHASVIELIENAVKESQGGVFGYMNDSTGIQNFPARLTHWVSRYSEVKSLQYLCRFVIRETYPRHHIRHLPLPKKINEYILENQY